MKDIHKCNKGLTLIELVVTMALLLIIIIMASSIFLLNNQTFYQEKNYYEIQNDVRIVTEHITKQVRNSKSLEIISVDEVQEEKPYNYIFFQDDGRVQFILIDGEDYDYQSLGSYINTGSSSFSRISDNKLKISVGAQSGNQEYQSELVINLVNFHLINPPPKISGTQGQAIKFELP